MCSIILNWTAISALSTVVGTAIVAWYTFETHKLRLLGQRQLEVMSAAVQPHFIFKIEPILDLKSPLTLTVHNHGGPARNIFPNADPLEFEIQSSLLAQGSHQHWKLTPKDKTKDIYSMDFDFCIRFEDQHGITQNWFYRRREDLVTQIRE